MMALYRRALLFSLMSVLLGSLLLLAGCNTLLDGENQATRQARQERNDALATQMAGSLRRTSAAETELAQSTHIAATDTVLAEQAEATAEVIAEITHQAQRTATQEAWQMQSTQTSVAFDLLLQEARQWPELLTDSFDSWSYDWPRGRQDGQYNSFAWTLAEGKYHWEVQGKTGFTFWTYPDDQPVWNEYLSVEIQRLGGSPDAEAGLVFHAVDQDYWCFLISGEGSLFIGKMAGGDWEVSWPLSSSAVLADQSNLLEVITQDGYSIFLINGFNLMGMSAGEDQPGAAGLMVSLWNAGDQATWEFDNFQVRQSPEPSP